MGCSTGAATTALRQGIATLAPGYFALVMATGIVSLAAHLVGMTGIAKALLGFNALAYVVLWTLTLARGLLFRDHLIADLRNPARAVGFLTMVAATCVLGSQVATLTPYRSLADGLWLLGIGLWLALVYGFLAITTTLRAKPSLAASISGSWLLLTVATQSIAVLGASLAPGLGPWREGALFLSLVAFLIGCMLYFPIIGLIVYRWEFLPLTPRDLTPSYWINMGATAISTLAGSHLLLAGGQWTLLQELRPFLAGVTLMFWAFGTWWIPLLLVLAEWRQVAGCLRLAYDLQYWSLVFPVGMYTACTWMLADAIGLPALHLIPTVTIYAALLAWLLTFVGLVHHLARHVCAPVAADPP